MAVSAVSITSEQARQFREEGFFVLKRTLPTGDLETLRGECQRFIDERNREMDQLGVDKLDLDRRGSRYFVHAYAKSPAVERFLSSDLMLQIAQAALGDTIYLFNEQYVVKAAEQGMPFSWHQDSGFINYPHLPYLTCWIALTDATPENGCVVAMPGAHRHGTLQHVDTPIGQECWGDRAHAVEIPVRAGSIVVFTSLTPHHTERNTTDAVRKAYIVQYAPEGAVAYRPQPDGSRGPAEPLDDERRQYVVVRGGELVGV